MSRYFVDPEDFYDLDDLDDPAENSSRIKKIKESKGKPKGSMSDQFKRMEMNKNYSGELKAIKRLRRNSIRFKGDEF